MAKVRGKYKRKQATKPEDILGLSNRPEGQGSTGYARGGMRIRPKGVEQSSNPSECHGLCPWVSTDWMPPPVENIPSWSVLRGTIPSLFELTADEQDAIYEAANRLPLSALDLSDKSWAKLAGISILSDDPFLVLLSLTVDYLLESRIDGTSVEAIINGFSSLARQCIGRAPNLKTLAEFPIITDLEVETIRRFRIDSSGAPSRYSALLGSSGLTLWGDVGGKTERDLFESSNLPDALESIHAIWKAKACASIALSLTSKLGWNEQPSEEAFALFVELFSGAKVNRESGVVYDEAQIPQMFCLVGS